ncbi:hypothetical protein MTO96_041942 [Rhipicephalus appendiculatus]
MSEGSSSRFALSVHLLPLNDVQSLPTYETPYSLSWIYLTFTSPPVLSAGFRWAVQNDVTYSEHRLVEVQIGATPAPGKRLTYAQHVLLEALRRGRWFLRVSGAAIISTEAIGWVVAAFYRLYDRLYRRHLRPIRTRPNSHPWFTPQLAIELAEVAAKRRCFQRSRDPVMRYFYRGEYAAALSAFRGNIKATRDQHVRGYALSCVRASLFSSPFKAAFSRPHQFPLPAASRGS